MLSTLSCLNIFFFQSDVSLEGYRKHIVAKTAAAPLTDAEMELKELKKNEVCLMPYPSMPVPISRDAYHFFWIHCNVLIHC